MTNTVVDARLMGVKAEYHEELAGVLRRLEARFSVGAVSALEWQVAEMRVLHVYRHLGREG